MFNSKPKSDCWCCDGIKHMFARRYGRHIYVFAEPPIERLNLPVSFWLATRSVEQKHLHTHVRCEYPVTISTRVPIKYCPWCGKNLLKFYGANFQHLLDDGISAEHAVPETAIHQKNPPTDSE